MPAKARTLSIIVEWEGGRRAACSVTPDLSYATINNDAFYDRYRGMSTFPRKKCFLKDGLLNPFRPAVPFSGQTIRIIGSLSPERDCGATRGLTQNRRNGNLNNVFVYLGHKITDRDAI